MDNQTNCTLKRVFEAETVYFYQIIVSLFTLIEYLGEKMAYSQNLRHNPLLWKKTLRLIVRKVIPGIKLSLECIQNRLFTSPEQIQSVSRILIVHSDLI